MSRSSLPRVAVVSGGAVAVALLAGGIAAAVVLGGGSSTPQARTTTATPTPPPPAAQVAFVGERSGHVPWDRPLQVSITNGRITKVVATAGDGSLIDGTVDAAGSRWAGEGTLVPLTAYTATVDYTDLLKHHREVTLRTAAADAARHLTAELSPGDGDVVGVGMPVAIYFNRAVPTAERAAVEQRLAVIADPAAAGAWHWMSGTEVHWRPPTYWKAGTHVTVSSDLDHLYLGDGVWGSGQHSVSYRIGDAHFSVVDVARHTMTTYVNGRVVRTVPVSTGRDKYPTMNGNLIALEKSPMVIMDSATVGIPRNSPDGYYEKVYWNVRLTYGGTFVHAAPWSVADQGVVNVSHGCVNVSPTNAQWFYNFAQRGDVVSIYNSTRGPNLSDPGAMDWNMSWSQWLAGQAGPVTAAQAAAPSTYHGSVPPAPAPPPSATPAPAATTPAPTASPTPTRTAVTTASPKPTASPTGH